MLYNYFKWNIWKRFMQFSSDLNVLTTNSN